MTREFGSSAENGVASGYTKHMEIAYGCCLLNVYHRNQCTKTLFVGVWKHPDFLATLARDNGHVIKREIS